ncbi:MAG TPA: ion transporter [Clostridiales bacterium]|nr:ion transporter [Clostridiales bacterium]HQP70516.1 ion transporter [Clostridiales bacterium]
MRKKLHHSFESGSLALITQALVFLYIIVYTFETVPSFLEYYKYFFLFDSIFLSIFTVEYAMRIWSAPKRRSYIFSFFGIVDLISILPSLFTIGIINFQGIRIARLMRLFKIFKNKSVNASVQRLKSAFVMIRSELLVFMFIVILLLYFSAVGIYTFEHTAQPDKFSSIPESLWWALTTFTTVGYGDMYPITTGGRIFTSLVLIIGLALVAIPTGLIASSLSSISAKEKNDL